MAEYDQVVVGAGIVGSCTALQLLRRGKRVLLIEQFGADGSKGCSQGRSRIIRTGYAEPHFVRMMPHAFRLWEELERDSDTQLLVRQSILFLSESPDHPRFPTTVANMKRECPQHLQEHDPAWLRERFGDKMRYSDGASVALDTTGGAVLADKALRAVRALFVKEGGHLWDDCRVTDIVPDDPRVMLTTPRGEVTTGSVVVTAGCWTQNLLVPRLVPFLPLQPVAVRVYYWQEKVADAYSATSGFPCLLDMGNPDGRDIYALPSIEHPGLAKVCIHGGTPFDPDEESDPDQDPTLLEDLKRYVEKHLPLLESEPARIETCMYNVTPDEVFVLDTLPEHRNIVIGAGFSGTGFKTAPIVGRLLADLATGAPPTLDLGPYALSRFGP